MALFAAALPFLAQAGVSLLGNALGQDKADRRGQQLLQQSRGPANVNSPFGSFSQNDVGDVTLGITSGQQNDLNNIRGTRAGLFGQVNDPEFIQNEVDRLRGIARPREDAVRASLRSQLFNRGRLGVGVGGGINGVMFNPELAALEEGLARADLSRVDQAFDTRSQLLGNISGLFNNEFGVNSQARSLAGVAAGLRPSQAGLSGVTAANQRAVNSNDAFFASLAQGVGNLDFDGIFDGGGSGNSGGVLGALGGLF